jgi:hypothetical protein
MKKTTIQTGNAKELNETRDSVKASDFWQTDVLRKIEYFELNEIESKQ